MLVYVTTSQKIDHEFNQWIDDSDNDESKIIYQVYLGFMATETGKQFITKSGLLCFTVDDWVTAFKQWIDQEIADNQKNADNIRKWSDSLIRLLSSDWGIKRKLVVTEFYEDTESPVKQD